MQVMNTAPYVNYKAVAIMYLSCNLLNPSDLKSRAVFKQTAFRDHLDDPNPFPILSPALYPSDWC